MPGHEHHMHDNILDDLDVSVVTLTQDLVLRSYSRCAASMLCLTEDNIGKQLPTLVPALREPLLADWVAEAARTGKCVSNDVPVGDDTWFEVKVCSQGRDGNKAVLVAFTDITEHKKSELRLRDAQEYSESIVQTVREPLLVLGEDLRVEDANKAFYEKFEVSHEETKGRFVYDLGNGQWNIPGLRRLLEEILPQSTEFNNYDVEHDFPSIGHKTMQLNARQVDWKSEHRKLILLAIEDATERKIAESRLHELYEKEHRVADTLQKALIVDVDHKLPDYEMVARYRPALEEAAVGGDFYDIVKLSDKRYLLVIGDVSGKGLDAAVFTAMCKYMLRAYVQESTPSSKVIERLNNALVEDMPEDMFVTIFCGYLDMRKHVLRYTSGGHEQPLIYRHKDSSVDRLPADGPVVGMFPDVAYKEAEVSLEPGDLILLYTDGITEARQNGEMYGIDGLSRTLAQSGELGEEQIAETVFNCAIEQNGGKLKDDAALVVIRRNDSG